MPRRSRLIAGLLCLAFVLAGAPVAAVTPDNPADAEAAQLAERVRREGKTQRGVLPLLELWGLWDEATPARLRELLEGVTERGRLSPPRRAMARHMLAQAYMRLGDDERAEKIFDELGFVSTFRVIGPFDNEGKTGFEQEQPPEAGRMQAPDLEAQYPGRERPVGWREFPDISRTGYVSLATILRPRQNVCGFAETFVHSERAQPLTLWVGAAGAVRVYWNGERVLEDAAYRQASIDRSVAGVGAHAGDNRLLVKVCVTEGAWGFSLRVGDAGGGPAKGLSYAVNSTHALDIPAGHSKVKLPRLVAPLDALEAAAERPKPTAQALGDLARYLRDTGSDDPAQRKAKQLAARAAELDPSPEHLELAAELAEERAEVMRFADIALKRHPDDPRAWLMQAGVASGGPSPEDALPWIDRVPENDRRWARAQLLRADVLEELELAATAARTVEHVIERTGPTVRTLGQLADLEHGAGNPDGSLALRKQMLSLRADAVGSRRVLINDALARGDYAEVLSHIDVLRRLSPGGVRNLLYLAHLYQAVGRDDLELSLLRHARTLVPESPEVHVAYGQALLRAEQTEMAAQAFFDALALKPQDTATRELLEQVKPRPRADEELAMPSSQILAARRESSGYPSTVLQDLTVNTVYDNGLGSSFRQLAVQVHDDEGARQHRTHSIQYDPDTQRVDLRLSRVYRKNGRVLESVRTYEQQLGEPWYRIYYDTRAVVVVFPDLEPGDVVELRYRVDDIAHRNLFADYYGDVHVFQGFTPVAHSEYVLITPASRRFYRNAPKMKGLAHTSVVEGERRIDRYVATDIPAIAPEAGMPGLMETSPYLHVSTYASWADVGRWYWGLIKDQLYADADLKRRVAELTQGATTTREKVERIHNWVVGHTRYVGLEFGIHGFLPYRVPLIVQRGFGDCKDKASLLYTMFREAGVDARIVLVRTRHNGNIEEAPASLSIFDHAIAYVPELDLYLDGTAEHSGTTELPAQDQGVMVLVVGPGGAELRKTPVLGADKNRRSRKLEVKLADDGSAQVHVDEEVIGGEAASYRGYYEAPGTRAERFERALADVYPGVKLEDQKFEGLSDLESPVRYSYSIAVPQLARWDGDELRLEPSILKDLVRSMARTPSRKHALDLQSHRAYVEEREVELPRGMRAAALPSGGEARSQFGSLSLHYEGSDGTVRARTEFTLTRDRVEPEEYPAFRRWVEQADQLLKQRIGIRRQQ